MDMVRLNGVATFIGIVGLTIAAGVLVVLLVIYFTWTYKEPGWIYSIHKGTDSLPYSMRKMMTDKALVRMLSVCETMGSTTTICSN
ncbi:calcium-transporting ATPase 9, plasma membrane-type-like isoform X1 [Zingiber officinale]|uniref:calcium-transporting ATPase 9, plasma membrane-type-like isoform X1 n=1 Tax=Zingiber officinale TaxID=94328 RepID=UPI001C4D801B|nr:calcium-transporting ATPase 9, plasma membrane-type-like isoform X1 [Zingiber officinale]